MISLKVNEIFGPTIQGEGPSMGRPAVFLRLAGCNLKCWWCDTRYSWDWDTHEPTEEIHTISVESAFERIVEKRSMTTPMVVITGGEPLLQQNALYDLLIALKNNPDRRVEVETNGTIFPNLILNLVDQFNVSPKLTNSLNGRSKIKLPPIKMAVLEDLASSGKAIFKFVVRDIADLNEISELGLDPRLVWIMPEGTCGALLSNHLHIVADEVIRRGWNITDRLHIRIWGKQRGR